MNHLQRKANEFLQRADDLTALLRRLADGDATALPQLASQCRRVPYDGHVWCLRVEELLTAHEDDIDADADALLDVSDEPAPPGVDVLDITPRGP